MKTKYGTKEVYRIKDINTGEYYLARHFVWIGSDNKPDKIYEDLVNRCKYFYQVGNINHHKYYLELSEVGHFYPSKIGAEKMLSEFTGCSKHDRKTPAGRVLNSKFNFVVVKSQVKVKDIND